MSTNLIKILIVIWFASIWTNWSPALVCIKSKRLCFLESLTHSVWPVTKLLATILPMPIQSWC